MEYEIGLDTNQLRRDSEKAKYLLNGIGNQADAEGRRLDASFSRAFAFAGGTAAISLLGKQILDTTAKFEKFGVVLNNTLGEVKGKESLDMIANFAATTPFQLDEVTGAFIKMANQGFVPTNNELIKLGDLASSTGKSFDQLSEAVLDAQTGEFERLKEFGIKASKNGDKVTFSFKEQKTTVDNTNSSIQAYILSLGELQGVQGANALISDSLTGKLSNLEDKLAAMYNQIGSANSGIMYTAIDGVSSLVDNYEDVGKVILGLVAIYGTYKATVLTINSINALQAKIAYQQMLANIGNTGATIQLTTAQGLQAIMASNLTRAQLALNKSMLANPYVLAATAVVALAAGVYYLTTQTTDAEKAHEKLQNSISNAESSIAAENVQIDTLFARLKAAKKGSEEYLAAKDAIQKKYGSYLSGLDEETKSLDNVAKAYDAIRTAAIGSAKARAMDKATQEAADDYTESTKDNLKDLQKLLDEKYGKNSKKSLELFYQLKPVVEGDGTSKVNDDFLKSFDKSVYQSNGSFASGTSYITNDLQELIDKSKEAKIAYKSVLNDAEKYIVGSRTKTTTPENANPTPSSKSETEAEKKARLAKEEKNLKDHQSKLEKYQVDLLKSQEDADKAEFDLLRSKITDKKDLIDLDYEQTMDAIAKEEKLFIDQAKTAGIKNPDTSKFKIQKETAVNKRVFDKQSLDNDDVKLEKEKLEAMLLEFETFNQKRERISKEYDGKISYLKSNNKNGSNNQNIQEAESQKSEALAAIDTQLAEKETTFKLLMNRISSMGLNELISALETAKTALAASTGTDNEKAVLRAKINALQKEIETAKAEAPIDNSKQQWESTLKVVEGVNSEISSIISNIDGLDDATKAALSAASNIAGAVIASISGIVSLSVVGAEAIKGVERASVILAIIGAAISIVTTIINLFTSAAKKRKEEQEKIIELQRQEYLGLISYNEELRSKYEWTKKIGETQLYYLGRTGEELKAQSAANQKDQDELAAKLAKATFKDGTEKKGHLTWNLGWKVEDVTKWSSLVGKSFEEISELSAQGKLSKDGQEYYEALKKAKEEGYDLADRQEELLQEVKETLTGTTQESLANSIIDGFKAGKRSAADFAETFESLMQTAVQSALKTMTEKRVNDWYDEFYELSKDGLTAAEQAKLKADWDAMIAATSQDATNIESTTGVSITDIGATRSASSKGFASMSQDSADELNGRFTAMQGHTYAISEGMKVLQTNSAQALKHLAGIETNTARLEAVENGINSLGVSMSSVKSGIETINTKGINIKV